MNALPGGAMAITFEVKKDFELKRKFVVDGKEYESLDEVPEEFRGAIANALASRGPATVINFNGKRIAGTEELPAPLRVIVGGLATMAVKHAEAEAKAKAEAKPEASGEQESASWTQPDAVRPEPIVGIPTIILLIGLGAFAIWLLHAVR